MADVVIVAILDSAEGLAHDDGSLAFLQIFAGLDDVEELTSLAQSI